MTHLGDPFTIADIRAGFATEAEAVHTFFSDIPADQFFTAPDDVWSAADNLVHLIISCSAIITGLRLPKAALRLRFGKATGPSRPLAESRHQYVEVALAAGGVATGGFVPVVKEHSAAERSRILDKWSQKGAAMVKNLGRWQDADLDTVNVPHPLLGDMTLREILFFTLYHNMHHVNDTARLLDRPEQEWFL